MSLKFGTDSVTDVKYRVGSTDNVVTVIKNNDGTVYWARPGTLSIDSKTGISSTTVSRSAAIEPTAGTGALSNGATVYHGDTLKLYPVAAQYWTISSPVTATVNFLATKTFAVSSALNPVRVTHSVQVVRDGNINSVSISYRDINDAPKTQSSTATTTSVSGVWNGGAFSVTPTSVADNWTASTVSANPIGTTTSMSIGASRWPYTITIPALDHATVAYTYTNTSSGTKSTGTTKNTSVTAWKGHDFSYQWTRATYYTFSGTSGATFTVTQNATIGKPTVGPWKKDVSIVLSNVTSASVKYGTSDSATTTDTVTTSTSVNAWTGRKVEWTSATPATNYTIAQAGEVAAGEGTRTLNITATAWMYSVTIPALAHSTISYQYYQGGAASPTTGTAKNTSVSAWKNHSFTYTWAAEQYYTITAGGSGEFNVTAASTVVAATITSWALEDTVKAIANATTSVKYHATDSDSEQTKSVTTSDVKFNAWTGCTITYTTTASTYYTYNNGKSTVNYSGASTSARVITPPSPIPYNRTITMNAQTNLEKITLTADGRSTVYQIPATGSIQDVAWSGYDISYTYTAASNYTTSSSGTLVKSENNATVPAATIGRWMYDITIPVVAHADIDYDYWDQQSTDVTHGAVEGTTVHAWKNHTFTYSWSANAYYCISSGGSGSFNVTQASTVVAATTTVYTPTCTFSPAANATYVAAYQTTDSSSSIKTTTVGLTTQTSNPWSGSAITYTVTANTYYTYPEGKTYTETAAAIHAGRTIAPSGAGRYCRTLSYTLGDNVLATSIQHWTMSSTSATISHVTASGSILRVWTGKPITVSATASTYYKIISGTGTYAESENSRDFTVSAGPKRRKIIVSNPDSACRLGITYSDAPGSTTYSICPSTQSAPSGEINNTWSGGSISYQFNTGSVPGAVWYNSGVTSGTIAAANNENDVTIDMSLKTFDFKYYSHGTITYYSDASMSTVITQSKYSTSRYYKYTSDGYYFLNGSVYTNVLSGTVPTASTNIVDGKWSALTSVPAKYSKLNINVKQRGATYFKLSTESSYTTLGLNSPGSTMLTTYVAAGSTVNVYANYVNYYGNYSGNSTTTYGTANDSYVSSSSPRTLTLSSSITTITFSGTLTARTVTINQEKAAHGTGVKLTYRRTSDGELATFENLTITKLTPYNVWRGATITLSSSGTFTPSTGWTTSGYATSYVYGTSTINHNVIATYSYVGTATNTSVFASGTSLSTTLYASSVSTTPSVMASGRHGSNYATVYMSSSETSKSSGSFTKALISVTRSNSTITATISGKTAQSARSVGITAVSPFIAPPAIRYYQDDSRHCFDGVVVYNPNTYAMNLNGQADVWTENQYDYEGATIDFAGSISSASVATYPYPNEIEPTVDGEINADISLRSQYTNSWSSTLTSYYEEFTMP